MTGPYYSDESTVLWHGDCVEVMRGMDDVSVDAICTDPPYSYAFMSRAWDSHETPHAFQAWCETWAREALRVLRPGGHMLAFGGTRTFHRLTCAIEDAGFEIRDSIASYGGTIPGPFATLTWVQGQGFPKSRNVSKDIDRDAGADREITNSYARKGRSGGILGTETDIVRDVTLPATDAARQWDGFGTALRPAHEPIVVARKPLTGTVASNVTRWGTGAINVDGCRVGTDDNLNGGAYSKEARQRTDLWATQRPGDKNSMRNGAAGEYEAPPGRWPSNVVLTHSASCTDRCVDGCPVRELDKQSGVSVGRSGGVAGWQDQYVGGSYTPIPRTGYDDAGSASRFFPTFRYEQECVLYGMLSGCERVLGASPRSPRIAPPPDTAPSDASASPSPRSADRSGRSPAPANTAASSSPTTALTADTAPEDASTKSAEWHAQRAASAANLCGSCATAIARSTARMRLGHSATQELGLPSTADFGERILTRSLALIAADLANSATTLTTTDWMTSLGCAADAISTYTTRASRQARRRSAQPSPEFPCLKYTAKAPTVERPSYVKDGAGDHRTGGNFAGGIRVCQVCNNRTKPGSWVPGDTRPWPGCGHEQWEWGTPIEQTGRVAHATVKPLDLMRFLVRLVTPPDGTVLDMFAGSGTTLEAAMLEGFNSIGIEQDADYLPLIAERIRRGKAQGHQPDLFGGAA